MTKIKTALVGMFGTTLSSSAGPVEFNAEGIAEVSEETAEYLKTNFPDVYYDAEGERPTPNSGKHLRPEDDPAVKEFARNHTARKNAEAAGAPALVVESSAKAEGKVAAAPLLDASGNPIEATAKTEGDDTEVNDEEVSKAEVSEEADGEEGKEEELDAETVAMLEKLSVKDIHATLVSAGVQDDETAKLKKKDVLIPIAAKKLT